MKKLVLFLMSAVMSFGLMSSGVYAVGTEIPSTYLEKYYYDFNTSMEGVDYAVFITDASSSSISFYFMYCGRNYSPLYTTQLLTAELKGNQAEFEWDDSWGNYGTGRITIYEDSVNLYAVTTVPSENNRGSIDTSNRDGSNSDGSLTLPSVENTGTVYKLIQSSASSAGAAESTADSAISIYLNGSPLSFTQAPYIENGVTMVPMRSIFEALGAEVDYDGSTKTITAVKGDKTVVLTVGSTQAYVNDSAYTLQNAPVIAEGSTMIPLRFVAESLDAEVNWDGGTKTITIN